MGQPEFARRRRLNFMIQTRRYHAATPLWLKPMRIIRPTSTCSSTPYARRLKNAPGFHGVASWRAGDNTGTTSGSSKSSIVSSKSSGPQLRKPQQIRRAREEERRKEYLKYVLIAKGYHLRVQTSLELLGKRVRSSLKLLRLQEYMGSAKKLMSQIIRRVRFNETIPHHEKSSPSSSPTPSGSARARRECRWNSDSGSTSSRSSINSSFTIR